MITTDDCWLFAGIGSFGSVGHGKIYLHGGKSQQAHEAMYQTVVGPVPKGKELDHLCENPPCINPDHLEPVTHHENTLRYYRRRTHCKLANFKNMADLFDPADVPYADFVDVYTEIAVKLHSESPQEPPEVL